MLSCDSEADIEDEFFTALALFKSTEKSSEVKLREMLLMSIAKRKKFFNHDKKIPFPTSAYENSNDISKQINLNIGKKFDYSRNNLINDENQIDSIEIPTISIPDEEFNDFVTCKICDGAKMDPFIILECQDCLDTYHPLCHQPPVNDIDVYDPRLVWRCGTCTGTCNEIVQENSFTLNSPRKNEINNINNAEKIQNIDRSNLVKSSSQLRTKTHSLSGNNIEERGTITIKDECCILSANQFRKRIGSKLTVSRLNSKS